MNKVIPIYPGDPQGDYDFNFFWEDPGHTCPYKEDLFDDHQSLCHCTPEETRNCADDI